MTEISLHGLTLTLPESFRWLPEAETPGLTLAAAVDPWPSTTAFRPNLTVEFGDPDPDAATIQQHGLRVIAGQLALGNLVVAVDVWRVEGKADGRRIISVYEALGTTIVQFQYAAIRAGRPLTLGVQAAASVFDYALGVFNAVVASLECEGEEDAEPAPEPPVELLDRLALERGEPLEYLGGIDSRQPFTALGPILSDEELEGLGPGKLGPEVDEVMKAPALTVEVGATLNGQPRSFRSYLTPGRGPAVIAAQSPPGYSGEGTAVSTQPSQSVPVALARWLGLAPAWSFAFTGEGGQARVDPDTLARRLRGEGVPVPDPLDPVLAAVWEGPWQVVELRCQGLINGARLVVMTQDRGSYSVDPAEGVLAPLPSASYLELLLSLCGFRRG